MPKIRDELNGEPLMTLDLDCWSDELSAAQLAAFETAESEHFSIRSKLNEIVNTSGSENLFLGEIFSAYQVPGPAPGLETIAKPVATVRKETKARQAAEEKRVKAERDAAKKRETKHIEPAEEEYDDNDDDDEEYVPISKRMAAKGVTRPYVKKTDKLEHTPKTPGRKPAAATAHLNPPAVPSTFRPTENTSIGGLSVGEKKKEVVDLTKDDTVTKLPPDSREVTFNKLQGKTFPSLVVVARPSLKVKENTNDRPALDAKVKGVLMHTATKFTEWLIQQGLVRSEQTCQIHSGSLKLGMYSDASKFAYSGGYVWISTCCPTRFVSVFNGSLFEGAPHPPSLLLKLIYHWSCQTNVQNVVQWVKVDNLYVKGLYSWLRSVCTVALYQHLTLLGGRGKRIEVGVISLGTTSQDGQKRQVKVEVLGVLDYESKIVRLRAVEPLNDGERNYKKRFSKILEPLGGWVHRDSQILTDLTVDKGTLQMMGFNNVVQATSADGKSLSKSSNANIMDYLRRIVPRMFQNTLSLLSRQIIQQFLDELVWREWYGTTPGVAFDNIVAHISEQTRLDARDTLVARLNKVSANPFKNWGHLAVKTPAKKLRDDFFNAPSTSAVASTSAATPTTTGAKRGRKRREPSPEYTPYNKNKIIKEEPKRIKIEPKLPTKVSYVEEIKKPDTVMLESYYYGILKQDAVTFSAKPIKFKAQCPECHETLTNNIKMMNHLKQHANPKENGGQQCHYCLEWVESDKLLPKHLALSHPLETKNSLSSGPECIICETRYSSTSMLAAHMQKTHAHSDLPYKCGCCNYASSSLRHTIDHFHKHHSESGMLQCPFCMQIYGAVNNHGDEQAPNIREYLEHLKVHMDKAQCKKCPRCVLNFTHKGTLKVHSMYAHTSQNQRNRSFVTMCKSSTKIIKPKYRSGTLKENINFVEKFPTLGLIVDNGKLCLECDTDFEEKSHFAGLMKCHKCKYQTCCLRAMMEHASACMGINLEASATCTLDTEMHCICGFSSSEGNALARHLATCDRRTVYASVEAAQENTVKRNMLDVLELVRRDDEEESDDLLQPVSDSRARADSDDDNDGSGSAAELPPPPAPATDAGDEPMDTSDPQQFNTQLSLDDLAPPSVAPQPETDRTPQLSDEYQSLATPRVGPTTDNMQEFEALPAESTQQAFDTL